MVPSPLTGSKVNAGSGCRHRGQTTSGGACSRPQREQRARASTWSAAAVPVRRRAIVRHRGRASAGHGMTAVSFRRVMSSQSYPSSNRMASVCSPCSGAGRKLRRPLVELHRYGRQPVGRPALDRHLADVVVGEHLRVGEQLLDRLHGRPGGVELPPAAPSIRRTSGWRTPRRARRHTSSPMGVPGVVVDEARVVTEIGAVDQVDRTGPSSDRTRGTRAGCGGRRPCDRCRPAD